MTSEKKLHVLHIASGDLWAGAEVQLFTLARALHKRGDTRVTVLLMNEGELAERLRQAGIEVYVLPESKLSFPQLLVKTIALTKRLHPDLIHTHRIKENLLGGIAGLILRIPSLRTQHGAEEHPANWYSPHKLLLRNINLFFAKHLQECVVAVTPHLATQLGEEISPRRIRTIENGVDLDLLASNSPQEAMEAPFANAKRRVGIVGRLVPVKRVDIFLDMALLIAQNTDFKDVRFFVFGDGPLKESLSSRAISINLGKNLHFMGHKTNISSYLSQLDALVMCSDNEGMPMTLLEAMSLKVSVVGHDVGGIHQLLKGGENGYPVTIQNASEYANALAESLAQKQGTAKRCTSAANLVKCHYSADKNADAYRSLYLDACRPQKRLAKQ